MPSFAVAVAYMLQSTEYEPRAYIRWLYRAGDFGAVMHRRTLDRTKVAGAFLLFLRIGILLQVAVGVALLIAGLAGYRAELIITSIFVILLAPIVWAHLVILPLIVARYIVIKPRLARMNTVTAKIFKEHSATKIAVAGSYGKTTMKELLTTVLSVKHVVASTPGNKNVASAHYQFATKLSGDEDVLIVEFGEGKPGDVEGFTNVVAPDVAVITGLAPAHLDQYGTIEEAGKDIFSLAKIVGPSGSYVNGESPPAKSFIESDQITFSAQGVDGWSVSDVSIDINGTHFTMAKNNKKIRISSGLIGKHLIGVMAATAAIAHRLGLDPSQIEAGFKKTVPYEHRMQPYRLGGAWVIDDSYNGNIQGVRAGIELLATLDATRKIYVTPGLVEQGNESDSIHTDIGTIIASGKPDIVVLMNNSTTRHISNGLMQAGFAGELIVQPDPLQFYTNLDQFVASGDIVLLQNDWTDNYA